ncbi:MAG: phosphoadenylyl-sulfate reductase [Crocinitomicaceae bacterium]|nr:phosphoadenylyl-sulfate reductase [Crocinitomicaceae bacterium]NGF75973.1 phosphoadenylyl-sulfate reductase [Fluviicola sp. SGL-29]
MKPDFFEHINTENITDLLTEMTETPGVAAAFSTSMSLEDQVITDVIFKNNLPIRVFTLDTGRLFNESYSVLSSTRNHYGKEIETYYPDAEALQELITTKGPNLFYESVENRKSCCHIRKVEPLNRALSGVNVWITGLRAEHSDNRTGLSVFEWDASRQLTKVNPLIHWTTEDVRSYIRNNHVPYNTLQDKGFISLGCQPCTRAVKEGEPFRAGRWWWEDHSKKECGLHT